MDPDSKWFSRMWLLAILVIVIIGAAWLIGRIEATPAINAILVVLGLFTAGNGVEKVAKAIVAKKTT